MVATVVSSYGLTSVSTRSERPSRHSPAMNWRSTGLPAKVAVDVRVVVVMAPPASSSDAPPKVSRSLRRCLRCALRLAHLVQGLLVDDVGDRPSRAVFAVLPGGLSPARRLEPAALAQHGEEDLGLLLTEAGQLLQATQDLGPVGVAVGPHPGDVAAVVVEYGRAERAASLGRRARVAVDGRGLAHDLGELLEVDPRQPFGVEAAEPPMQLVRAGERALHGHLLIEQHADDEGERVGGQQPVSGLIAGEVQVVFHALILPPGGGGYDPATTSSTAWP